MQRMTFLATVLFFFCALITFVARDTDVAQDTNNPKTPAATVQIDQAGSTFDFLAEIGMEPIVDENALQVSEVTCIGADSLVVIQGTPHWDNLYFVHAYDRDDGTTVRLNLKEPHDTGAGDARLAKATNIGRDQPGKRPGAVGRL